MQDPGAGDEGLYLGQEAVNAGGLLQGRVWQPQAKTKKQEVLEGEIKANSGQLKVNILGQICKSLQINVGFDLIFAQISHRFCIGFEQILHRFCKDFSQIGTDLHRFCYKLAQICKDFFTNWHRFASIFYKLAQIRIDFLQIGTDLHRFFNKLAQIRIDSYDILGCCCTKNKNLSIF